MCLVPARNGDRIARDDRDGRKALAEHIPRNDYSEPKITYLKDTGKGLDRSAMTHGNSVRKPISARGITSNVRIPELNQNF